MFVISLIIYIFLMPCRVQLGDADKLILLDVARVLTARGLKQWTSVRELIWLLLSRRVEVWDGVRHLRASHLALCYRWAECHRAMVVLGARLPAVARKALLNLARTFVHGVAASSNIRTAFREAVTGGRRVECRGAFGDVASVGVFVLPESVSSATRVRGRRLGGEPDYLTGLPAAPRLPEASVDWMDFDGKAVRVVSCWKSSHRWFRRGGSRPIRDRSAELDSLVSGLAPLVAQRGWPETPLTPTLLRGKSQLAPPAAGHEVVFGSKDGKLSYRSDRLWRLTKRYVYALLRRGRVVYPEEVCALLSLSPYHSLLDRLSLGFKPQAVVRALTQGVHGGHSGDISDLFAAVAGLDGRLVRAMFVGSGVNTVAMNLDERLGSAGWEYVARVEANPSMAYMHDVAWAGRGFAALERAEDEVRLPEGVAPPSEVCITLRCQPWSWLCIDGISQLERAVAERAAAYRAVRALDPEIVVDEMLSRARMGGKAVAWERVEYVRESIFERMVWFLLDADPGSGADVWSCSRRELAVGVKPRYVHVVTDVLRSAGYVPV